MNPPLIGITTYGEDEQRHFPLPREYVDSVRRAGGVPILLPPGERRLRELFALLDGLILAGGGDLDPSVYGGTDHETIYMTDIERDAEELQLARMAIDTGKPTLGICRGIQVLNVVLGGTLHEHLPDIVGEEILHRLPPRAPGEHSIAVTPGSRLAKIMGELEFSAASWHHQAIRDVADPLEVVAHAPDGTIEAVEMPSHRWLIGVQWHPELTSATDPLQQQLFDTFVRETIRLRKKP